MKLAALLTTCCIAFAPIHMAAQVASRSADLEQRLKNIFVGKVVHLQIPYSANQVTFGLDGNCVNHCERGSWAGDDVVQIEQIHLEHGQLRLAGRRMVVFFGLDGKENSVFRSGVELRLAVPSIMDDAAIGRVLVAVFRGGDKPNPNSPPPEGTPIGYQCKEEKSARFCRQKDSNEYVAIRDIRGPLDVGITADGEKIYLAKSPVTPPRVIKAPDPKFPDAERQPGHEGTAGLRAVVDIFGRIRDIQVTHAADPGFAIAAASAVAEWTFHPATLNGQPVNCLINFEVNFRL